MWIKICGITTLQDAQMAVASGADAVGFVFAESPRNVNPEAVREISSRLPNSIEKIGIFVDATADEMADTIRVAGLTGVQWHGDLRKGLSYDLRERVRETRGQLRILQVLHHDEDLQRFEIQLRELQMNMELDAVLVDTRVAGKRGGTGVPFNWQAARDSFLQHVPHIRLIAAGGLRPENVRQAIHTLRPWGVDVSSGVETAPGCKDLQRVRSFVQVARAADMELWNAEVLAQATREYARQQD